MLRQKLKSSGLAKQEKQREQGREIAPSLFYWQLNLFVYSQSYIIPIDLRIVETFRNCRDRANKINLAVDILNK